VSGGGANAGQIVGGLLSRKIGKQKYQLIVCSLLTVIFLGGMSVLYLSRPSISNFLSFLYSSSSVTDSIRTSTNNSQLALAQRPITKTPSSSSYSLAPSGMAGPIPSVSASAA
jgi:hypothetical protein